MDTIDIHVHFFPDNIAPAAMKKLSDLSGIRPSGDGTYDSLAGLMKEEGIDLAVAQPVATDPGQVESINRRVVKLNNAGGPVISFGAMHPGYIGTGKMPGELNFLSRNGVKGIKLHCEYQEFYPDDDALIGFYEYCVKNNILILFHS